MKKALSTLLSMLCLGALLAPAAWAQDRIYRCGNEYTNNTSMAKERGCKVVEGGNVTVLQGTRPTPTAAPAPAAQGSSAPAASSPPSAPRVDASAQRARDSDARAIFEAELRKAEARLAELNREYNNGAPERTALDLRNPQHYMERTAEIKANMARTASDIESIRRELGRVGATGSR